MPRAQWGGGGDYSSVFSGMARQFEGTLINAQQEGVQRAKADAEAKAAEVYNQWKNGQISDAEWIAFLKQKVAESAGDPEDHQRWSDALRDHEGAILDAQMEANYSMGKLSLAGLMAHYSRQMQGVETNSPKWRDYAARYAQIQNAIRSGSGGGGGGGGGGSSRGRAGIKAAQGVLSTHPDGFAFDVNGEDIINPANNVVGFANGEDYLNNLFSDVRRIDILMDQMKADPSLKTFHDPYTSWDIPVTPDMLTELDRQYLRTEDQIVAYTEALGTTDGFEAAQKARAAKQNYINGPMMQHNADRVKPVYDALVQSTAERVAAAGDMADPAARLAVYKDIAKQWSSFEDGTLQGMGGRGLQEAYMGTINVRGNLESADQPGTPSPRVLHWTQALPDELQVSGDIFRQSEAWKNFFGQMTNTELDPTQRNLLIQEFVDTVSGGEGQIDKADVLKMIEGDDGSAGGRPITGILETHDQFNGTRFANDPNYGGPRFVYVQDGNGTHLVPAEPRDTPHDGGNVTQQLVPAGVETTGLVQVLTKIGGQMTTVWAEPAPVNDPRFIAYRADSDFQVGSTKFKKGEYIPSQWIAQNGGVRGLNRLIAGGQVARESQVQAIDTPDGGRWFIDPETRLASRQPPALAEQDPVTGGIKVGDDKKIDLHYGTSAGSVFMPFYGVDRKTAQGYISRQIREGGIIPSDFGYRNQAGEVLNGPDADGMWSDLDVDQMYWSKMDEAKEGSHRTRLKYGGSRSDAAIEARRRGAANEDFVRSAVNDKVTTPSFGDILRDPLGSIKQFARNMGIQVDSPFDTQAAAREAAKPPRPLDFLPADDAVFGVHQRQAEIAAQKRSLITPRLPAEVSVPPTQRAELPVPPPPVAAIAAGRTYTAARNREAGTPPVPVRPEVAPVNVPGRYHGKRLPT
jgi:hypothetical protein